ncbi:MAG: PEGA domain-containing protein [Cellulosilyticaceae bacterium]
MQGNKLFVKVMIITGVMGLMALVIGLFMGIRYLGIEAKSENQPGEGQVYELPGEGSETAQMMCMIEGLEGNEIGYIDVKSQVFAKIDAAEAVIVREKNSERMPLTALNVGDLVMITYDTQTKLALEIDKIPESWVKQELIGIKIDELQKQIMIGENSYVYDETLLVWDQNGERIDLSQIGPYDKLDVGGIGAHIYSIKVIERQGYILLDQLPSEEGILEIDINRQIPVERVQEPVPVTAGMHKVTIRLKGYEPVTHRIEVRPEEVLKVDLKGAKLIYGQLEVQVLEGVKDYEIHIGPKIYKPGEPIEVLEGKYDVIVVASGYKPWGMRVDITGKVVLQVTLQEDEKEKREDEEDAQDRNGEQIENVEGNYCINVMTEPTGAKVIINGEDHGITPFTTTLKVGDYSILLRKEGYEDYSTSIIIDNSDNQNNYLYALTPKN